MNKHIQTFLIEKDGVRICELRVHEDSVQINDGAKGWVSIPKPQAKQLFKIGSEILK